MNSDQQKQPARVPAVIDVWQWYPGSRSCRRLRPTVLSMSHVLSLARTEDAPESELKQALNRVTDEIGIHGIHENLLVKRSRISAALGLWQASKEDARQVGLSTLKMQNKYNFRSL
jgi:hypothetical protein